MAFVVEDGTGLSTATSLCSVADADSHFATHPKGSTRWPSTLTTGQKESKLQYASAIAARRLKWRGDPLTNGQAFPVPAEHLVDYLGRAVSVASVPVDVARGIAELAGLVDENGVITAESSTVRSKSTGPASVTYAGEGSGAGSIAGIPLEVINWLRPFIFTQPMLLRA